MVLEPGRYIVSVREGLLRSYHFLRIVRRGKKIYYKVDNGIPVAIDVDAFRSEMSSFRVEYKFKPKEKVRYTQYRFIVEFSTQAGTSHTIVANSKYAFEKILKDFPGLNNLP